MGKKGSNTAISVLKRREEILGLMLSGFTHSDLRTYFSMYHPSLSEHSLIKDISWAYDQLDKYTMKDGSIVINKHVMLYDKIIRDSIDTAYTREVALKAMAQKEKLLNLHRPDVAVQVNNNMLNLDHLSVEDLQKLLTKTDKD